MFTCVQCYVRTCIQSVNSICSVYICSYVESNKLEYVRTYVVNNKANLTILLEDRGGSKTSVMYVYFNL